MIEKLLIQGIRSFNERDGQTIHFIGPLTLIVGYNGSGKTTTIECLKYATTGELPSNSKTGGAFIHDPALTGSAEVMAQVKLSFISTNGTKLVVTRKLQVTQKKATKSQKTIETTLKVARSGEGSHLSKSVAEVDQLMPQYLGASKAILEYVIFCHQDESLWPLSDSSSLKKRFDDIFDAAKYTKAIDNLKLLRKAQKDKQGELKLTVEHSKSNKDKGAKVELRMVELNKEMNVLQAEIKDLQKKIDHAVDQSQIAWSHYSRFATNVGELKNKRNKASDLEESIGNTKQHMKEMEDSDDELQDMLDQYEERMAMLERESEQLLAHYQALHQDVEAARKDVGDKQTEVGEHRARKEQYERQLKNRAQVVKDTARRHNIRGFDLEITDEHVRDFMDRIARMAKDQKRALEKAKQESQDELQNAQRLLNDAQNRRLGLDQRKESARAEITNNDRKTSTLQSDLNGIDVDEGGKAVLESTMEDLQQRLTTAKATFDAADWSSQIEAVDMTLQSLDEQSKRLNSELVNASKQAGDFARLDLLHKDLRDSQQRLEVMNKAHAVNIGNVVGEEWSPASLERDYDGVLSQKSSDLREAENRRDGVSRELDQVEGKLVSTTAERKSKVKEMLAAENTVKTAIDTDAEDFVEILLTLQGNRDEMRGDTTSFTVMKQYYEGCIGALQDHNVCRLCMRGFKAEKDKNAFMASLEKKLHDVTAKVVESEIEKTETELARLKSVQSHYDTWVRLKDVEIPALEKEQLALDTRRASLIAEVDQKDQSVNEFQGAKRDVEAIQKTVLTIIKLHTDIGNSERQIGELEGQQAASRASRRVDQIQEDTENVRDQSRRANGTLAQLKDGRETAEKAIANLDRELLKTKGTLDRALYQLKEKSNVQGQIEELKVSNEKQKEIIRNIEQESGGLAQEIAQASETCKETRRRGDDRVSELQQIDAKLSNSSNQLSLADSEIKAYLDEGGPQQLAASQREVERLEHEIFKMEQDKMAWTGKIKKIEEQLKSQETTRRDISENLRYRQNVRDLSTLRTEIMELEGENAQEDQSRYEREARAWDDKRTLLAADKATAAGSLRSKDEHYMELHRDWETDYQKAPEIYRQAMVRFETSKSCHDDIGKYIGALEKAIIKFHSIKMEEINRIIEELWKKTYQGTDVDTIVIRSDNESQRGNRSYNYRVSMIKGDVEMDMRGRCSAGQKVLASIIIRLALAECFGVNCGIIALDEPTTNLDRDNIRALAESLAEIIRIRRRQSNFQLIIITHDEDFLRHMNCPEFVDDYWRIARDENMKSMIRKQNIGEVMHD